MNGRTYSHAYYTNVKIFCYLINIIEYKYILLSYY